MAKDPGFSAAFAAARKKLGAGKTFTYNGKSYSTNRADDKPAAKAPTAAQKPKARPASIGASAAGGARPTVGGPGKMPAAPRKAAGTPTAGYNPSPKPAQPVNPNLRTQAGRAAAVGQGVRPQGAPKPPKAAAPAPAPRAGGIFSKIGDFLGSGGYAGYKAREAVKKKP